MLLTTNDLEITVQFIGLKSQCERFGQNLVKALKGSLDEVEKITEFQCNLYSEYLLYKNHSSNFEITAPPSGGLGLVFKFPGNTHKLNDRLKMKKWFDLFRENGRNFALVKNVIFYKLVSYGLPNKLRGELWETCCGSLYLRYQNSEEYNTILIEKGVDRLFLEEP
ncbi:unnamed protein product [Ambrosiozyma monospora]|uniref:Unnamed protein product n=1 Tax=Ambrosiozyma monospora TaxID=43982 RepID=A0ACB5U7V2_AMBMO|nr:unnamed protein product [Ambrosiozyma monospora]